MSTEISVIPKSPSEVAKAVLYIGLTALALVQSGAHTTTGVIAIVIAVVGLIPVYLLAGTWVKTGAAFLVAALQALVLLILPGFGLGSVGWSGWISVALAAFAAIGIAVVPNKPTVPVDPTDPA